MKYPTTLVDLDGNWWGIFEGHGLSIFDLAAGLIPLIGDRPVGTTLLVNEECLHFVPRIKHCSRVDGWGCYNEGEWHGHWFEVKPSESAEGIKYTLSRWSEPTSSGSQTEGADQ